MSKIIAIVNQKGGVGKTTTAINLSACLAEKGKKVLLIDSDPQGNTTSGLGVEKQKDLIGTYDALINETPMAECIVETKYKKLFLCPSSIELAGAEIELVAASGREYRLKNALHEIESKFDYILIDCPPSLGLITLNSLVAAKSVLVPIQCEYYALEGLSQLMATLRTIKKALNPNIEIEGVLLTMFDGRTNLSIQVADEVKKFFPQKVYKTIIPRNVRLSEAPSFGEAIITYDKYSKGAQSYTELAEEIIAINK